MPNVKDAEKSDDSIYRVYTDGSRIDEQIGASAVLYMRSIKQGALCLHLGSNEQHTTFKGESVGGCLALALLLDLPEVQGLVTIAVDSQPAILATDVHAPNPSHYLGHLAQVSASFSAAAPGSPNHHLMDTGTRRHHRE